MQGVWAFRRDGGPFLAGRSVGRFGGLFTRAGGFLRIRGVSTQNGSAPGLHVSHSMVLGVAAVQLGRVVGWFYSLRVHVATCASNLLYKQCSKSVNTRTAVCTCTPFSRQAGHFSPPCLLDYEWVCGGARAVWYVIPLQPALLLVHTMLAPVIEASFVGVGERSGQGSCFFCTVPLSCRWGIRMATGCLLGMG